MINFLKEKLTNARKQGDKVAMMLLQVILGEVATQQGRINTSTMAQEVKNLKKDLTDEQIESIIRGLVLKNNESLGMMKGKGMETHEEKLINENKFLNTLLPKTLSVEEIKVVLADLSDNIKAAKNDGMAIGLAMKFLKPKGLKVLGDDVKKAVEEMRT